MPVDFRNMHIIDPFSSVTLIIGAFKFWVNYFHKNGESLSMWLVCGSDSQDCQNIRVVYVFFDFFSHRETIVKSISVVIFKFFWTHTMCQVCCVATLELLNIAMGMSPSTTKRAICTVVPITLSWSYTTLFAISTLFVWSCQFCKQTLWSVEMICSSRHLFLKFLQPVTETFLIFVCSYNV